LENLISNGYKYLHRDVSSFGTRDFRVTNILVITEKDGVYFSVNIIEGRVYPDEYYTNPEEYIRTHSFIAKFK